MPAFKRRASVCEHAVEGSMYFSASSPPVATTRRDKGEAGHAPSPLQQEPATATRNVSLKAVGSEATRIEVPSPLQQAPSRCRQDKSLTAVGSEATRIDAACRVWKISHTLQGYPN